VVRGLPVTRRVGRRSVGSFGRKSIEKIVSDTERMENTPTHICANTAIVIWPSTESRRTSSFRNFLSFNHYFSKYFELVHSKCVYGNFNHRYKFFLFTSMPFWVWAILRRWFACSPTAYQVVCEVESLRNTGLMWHVRITENDWKQTFMYHYISIRKQHSGTLKIWKPWAGFLQKMYSRFVLRILRV
jgi:hypothetical protein